MAQLDPDLLALQEVRDQVARAKRACEAVRDYSQEQIDRLCQAMVQAGADAAYDLARLAVEETGIGRVHYKVLKNLFGTEGVWRSIRDERTVGIISRDNRAGTVEVATPVGVIACVIPTTNPTSTALFKAIISVKGRNACVISPHPRARRCIAESAEVLRRAIERAGGPPDLVCCLTNPTIESTGALMKSRDVSLILATGGSGLVRAAYSSGKPAYGVGPGNVPVYVDRTADVAWAAKAVVSSQSFDNATLCCSEQALVLDRPIAERMLGEMRARGAHLCDERETALLAAYCNKGGMMNADVVGIDPWIVAQKAGFQVPRHTSVLLAHQGGVGKEWPLSIEILCPLLSVHTVDGWEEGCAVSKSILHFGGLGHTMAVYSNEPEVLDQFFLQKPASRIIANGPTAQGAVGFSTNLVPSMSLGCGPQAGNITSDNITARHLLNVKRIGFPRADWDELDRSFHERAARWTGDAAPRGSGLPGDPALSVQAETAPAAAASPASNWLGNPAVEPPATPRPSAAMPARPAPRPSAAGSGSGSGVAQVTVRPAGGGGGQAARRAPTFVTPSPRPAARPSRGAASASSPPATTQVGGALSSSEIQSLLANAGHGCPLGPCKGCPHHDVKTGACNA